MSTLKFAKNSTLIALVIALMTVTTAVFADEDPVFTGRGNFAIRGYDAVAYHLDQKPVKGKREFTTDWNGATWRFKSAENRDKFVAEPERWAPAYGGYCAWAVSNGYTAKTDPDAWSIYMDRLFLNFNRSVRNTWSQDIPGNVQRGDANWPAVLSK